MYRYLGTFLMVLLLLNCEPRGEKLETIEVEDVDGNIEKFSRRVSDFAKIGHYQKFNAAKQLLEESYYVNDTQHLYRVLFYETGDTQIVETLNMGQYHGPFKAFYDNGQLELLGLYENNVATGQWKRYYNSGELMETVTFADNEENGPFSEYYQNGNLKTEGSYLNGDKEDGLLKMYNEEGVLIRKMDCDNGICQTIWKLEGQENLQEVDELKE